MVGLRRDEPAHRGSARNPIGGARAGGRSFSSSQRLLKDLSTNVRIDSRWKARRADHGARGLGGVALALAQAGADIALAAGSSWRARRTPTRSRATGRRAKGFQADVTKLAEVERLKGESRLRGPVDTGQPGGNKRGPIQELTERTGTS
jgi:hypothetical protein